MTKFQALFVKLLRVRYGFSWRAIHRDWQVRYVPKEDWYCNPANLKHKQTIIDNFPLPDKREQLRNLLDYPDGNQLIGIDLCNEAMEILGEKVEDGWN